MPWKPDYVTPAVVKDYLRIDGTADDAFIALWCTAASRNVDGYCHRQFGTPVAPVLREYRGVWDRGCGAYVYVIDDLSDVDDLVILDGDQVPVTDYSWEPVNAVADGRPYERLITEAGPVLTMETAGWGWPAVPSSISVGMLLMAARLSKRRDAVFGVAGSPSDGSELRLLAKLDPDMIMVLKGGGYRRSWWAA